MGWVVRYEAFPHWFRRSALSYRDILSKGPVMMDNWMRILIDGRQVGYTHTRLDMQDRNPLEPYLIQNRTVLDLNIMGQSRSVALYAEAGLDPLYNLQRFIFGVTAERYAIRIEGRRSGRRTFSGRVWSESGARRFAAEVPDDVLLDSPMMDMILGQLQPGDSLTVKTFNPVSLSASDMAVKAVRHETVQIGGAEKQALRLEVEFEGTILAAWVDSEGRLLRQETPMGWVLEACSADEAVQFATGPAPDLLRSVAVPTTGKVREPRQCRRLRLQFQKWPAEPTPIRNERQSILARGDGFLEMEVMGDVVPAGFGGGEADPLDLKPTLFVQADDPKIRQQAHSVRGGLTNAVDMALALNNWVYRSVAKVPTVSLPSAVDVLKQRQGDCNEHTYLFVALARALNIPARIRIGLVYTDGAFYYHAWPAVWTGQRWWELDPTLGQDAVDATHIALLEGELAEQLKLIGIIGRVSVSILEEDS